MIERSFDYRKIKKIISQYPVVSNDFIYLIDEGIGMWTYHEYKDGHRVHANALKKGRIAKQSFIKSFQWIFNNTTTNVIYAAISCDNKAACYFAANARMNRTHTHNHFNHYEIKKCSD